MTLVSKTTQPVLVLSEEASLQSDGACVPWGIAVSDFVTLLHEVPLPGHICVLGQSRFSQCARVTFPAPEPRDDARVFPDHFSAQDSQCRSSV